MVLTISDLISDTEDGKGFCVVSGGNMRFRYKSGGNVGDTYGGNCASVRREGKHQSQLLLETLYFLESMFGKSNNTTGK